MKAVVLKPGRDKAIRHRHHWIFSGAVRDMPDFEDGAVLPVRSADGGLLGHGYFNRKSSITGRMVSFGEGQERPAQVVGVDPPSDLAVLRYAFPLLRPPHRIPSL